MTNKYIIKNCPAIFYSGITPEPKCWQKWEQFDETCQNCSDCIMKQIVVLCKEKDYFVKRFPDAQFSSAVQNSELAFDVLQILDIEECE